MQTGKGAQCLSAGRLQMSFMDERDQVGGNFQGKIGHFGVLAQMHGQDLSHGVRGIGEESDHGSQQRSIAEP
jgi:hypothetical protein